MSQAQLPYHIQGAMKRYVEHGIPPGGFLEAVLCNNLKEAVGRADEINLANLVEIVKYCYWEIPHNCWGSPKQVRDWMSQKGLSHAKETKAETGPGDE